MLGLYDDAGCMFKLPYGYDKRIHGYSAVYSTKPVLSTRMNRDHRKIAQ